MRKWVGVDEMGLLLPFNVTLGVSEIVERRVFQNEGYLGYGSDMKRLTPMASNSRRLRNDLRTRKERHIELHTLQSLLKSMIPNIPSLSIESH